MKIINNRLLFALFLVVVQRGYAQGFMNLNFESANVLGYSPGYVPTSAALPSWTAYYGPSNNPTNVTTSIVSYVGTSLGGALVILVDANAPSGGAPLPIQGNYSALLEGSTLAAASTASIGQSGTIPITAKSLRVFTGIGGLGVLVSFNGQDLSFQAIGTGPNYTVYGSDISAYAGQTGQLLFTAPVQNTALLDNIQFSSSPIPEPSSFAVLGLGAVFFGLRRWRLRS